MLSYGTNNPWISIHRPNPQALVRLFCFPYSGSGASMFYKWPAALPSTIEVCAVQLPGRENRLSEPLLTRLRPLVEEAAQAIRPYLDRPFAFFGHSLGGLVGFELARYLRREHRISPVQLIVSGHKAPQLANEKQPIYDLSEPDFVAELRRFNGIPEEVLEHAELRQLVLPILRADFEIYETYDYEADLPLDCPITAMGGLEDDEVNRDQLELWREQTSSAFMLHMFPGDHFYLQTAQTLFLETLANELNQLVSRVSIRSYL